MADKTYVNPQELIKLEEELSALKKEYGIEEKPKKWILVGDWIASHMAKPKMVERKKYIKLALLCGWFCGAHRFYSGQKFIAILYLVFFWTGIPFAMTLIDLMIALPKETDESGMISI